MVHKKKCVLIILLTENKSQTAAGHTVLLILTSDTLSRVGL